MLVHPGRATFDEFGFRLGRPAGARAQRIAQLRQRIRVAPRRDSNSGLNRFSHRRQGRRVLDDLISRNPDSIVMLIATLRYGVGLLNIACYWPNLMMASPEEFAAI